MAIKETLAVDSGIKTEFIAEDHDGSFYIHKTQDIQPILESCKIQRDFELGRNHSVGRGIGRKVADIPAVLWNELVRQGISQDTKALLKWLDKHENKAFRTWDGQLG